MRGAWARLQLTIAKALPAKPAAVIAEHLAALDAPLKVVGRISEATLGHGAAYAGENDSGTPPFKLMSAFHPLRTLAVWRRRLPSLPSESVELARHSQEERCFRLSNIHHGFAAAVFSLFFEAHLRHRCLRSNEETLPVVFKGLGQGLWSLQGSGG